MSLGTDHERDPLGRASLCASGARVRRAVTAEVRSRLRAIDGFSSYPEVLNLIERLQRRGYREEDVRRVLGEHMLWALRLVRM